MQVVELMESDLTNPKIHDLLVKEFCTRLKQFQDEFGDGCDMDTIERCVRIFVDSSFFLGMGFESKKKFAVNLLACYTKKYCRLFGVKIESNSCAPCR
jgi:hypothetical protein